ncbi:MAG: hypothetical protein OEV74_18875 [Cyclobacteriaceae bacterium]|nr:hypothetical protein [Cyclobacteriaceae bacterium]
MKKIFFIFILLLLGCSEDNNESNPDYTWDIDKQGIPKFVNVNYIELNKISQISKFRSSVGHDYSDNYEQCRSMKHYFQPYGDINWGTVKIYSPISGTITRAEQEWAGTKLEIESSKYPAFRFQIFHINLEQPLEVNDKVTEGDYLGTHISNDTYSDVSVIVNDPAKQGRFVSWFYVITDQVFQEYIERGAITREDFIISKELRDANPLDCNNFGLDDPLEKWFILEVPIK